MFNISERERAEPLPRDIADARLTAAGVDRRDAILEAVASIAESFLSGASWQDGIDQTLERLGHAAQVSRAYIFELHEGEDGVLLASQRHEWVAPGVAPQINNPALQGSSLRHTGFARWEESLARGEPIFGNIREFPPSERPLLEAEQILSMAVVPVFAGKSWWGFMGFDECENEREWLGAELGALRAAAAIVGAFVQQRQAEAALQETQSRYRGLVESSPDAIVVHQGGILSYANPAAARLLGAPSPDDLLGRSVLEFVHPDFRSMVLSRLQRLREGRQVPLTEGRFVRLDGTPVEVEVASTPMTVDGKAAVQAVARDITDRRRAEEAVRESEARKASILQSALDGIITIDHEGRIVEFNPAAEEMFGRSRTAVLNRWLVDLIIPPRFREAHLGGLARYLSTGQPTIIGRRIELAALRADGTEFPIELTVTRVDVPGSPLFTAYIRDISERRVSEQALRESEERYRRLVERSPDGIVVHSAGKFVFANKAAARLLGAGTPEELIGRPLLDVVHPDYWGMVQEPAKLESDDGLEAPLVEQKFVRLDGAVVDVELAGIPLTYGGEQARQVVIRDITDRKRVESTLRQRGEYLSALHDTALGLMNRLDPRDLLGAIVTRAAALLDATDGVIYLADPERGELDLHVGVGLFADRVGERVERGEGPIGAVWGSSQPTVIDDFPTGAAPTSPWPHQAVRAGMAAPLMSGDQFLGIIGVARPEPGRWFDDEAMAVLQQFARLASIALDNARLYTEAQDQLRERERAEQQLREAETKFRSLVERIPAITYTAEFGETAPWLYVSPQIEAILGFTQEEWTVRPNLWSRQIHPDDRARVLADEVRSEETGLPMLCEYRLFAKDGRVTWVRDESVVVRGSDGEPLLQGVMFDITERKEAEEQLREAETRYRTLVEQIPAITYIDRFDEGGKFTQSIYYSPQIEGILGYRPEELVEGGEVLWGSIIHPEDRDRVLASESQHYRSRDPLEMEYRLRARDGREVWVLDEAVVVTDSDGHPRYSHGILYDITDRKQAEEDLERALHIERQATERLRALDELKNTFLHAVSHELRTPLAAVLGFALTLEREEIQLPAPERKDIVRRLAANARKLDQLLSDLLDLDRLDRGILEPRRKPTDVAALVRRVVENSEVLGTRPVRVQAQLVVTPIDGPKVERIVENLLVNAGRHTPPNCTIWVKVSSHEGGALITVEDEGQGVPKDLQEIIFEPFRQGPSAPAHSPGVGIGLSLVSRFAELHGGRAWVEDRPGGGASFHVFLPGTPG